MFPSIFLYFLIDDDKFPTKFSRFSNNIINSKFHFQIDWKREKEKKTVENPRPIKQHLLSRRKKKAMQIVQIFHLISFADSTGGQTISLRDIHGQWIDLLEEQEGGGWWARNFKIQMGRATASSCPSSCRCCCLWNRHGELDRASGEGEERGWDRYYTRLVINIRVIGIVR